MDFAKKLAAGIGDNMEDEQGQRQSNVQQNLGGSSSGHYRHDDDDELRGAAEVASREAGDSGDSDFFGSILNTLGQKKMSLASEDIDEDSAVQGHKKYFGDDDDGKEATSSSIGSAAAMQALKMFTGGNAPAAQSHGQTAGQGQFVALALSEASKLFDQQANQGKVSPEASKESAVMKAGEMALKMYLKGGQGGATSGPGGFLGLAEKLMK